MRRPFASGNSHETCIAELIEGAAHTARMQAAALDRGGYGSRCRDHGRRILRAEMAKSWLTGRMRQAEGIDGGGDASADSCVRLGISLGPIGNPRRNGRRSACWPRSLRSICFRSGSMFASTIGTTISITRFRNIIGGILATVRHLRSDRLCADRGCRLLALSAADPAHPLAPLADRPLFAQLARKSKLLPPAAEPRR